MGVITKADIPASRPFPYQAVLILSLCVTVNSYTLVNLFPYVGVMVKQLMGLESTNDAGFYAGYVASAFTLGRFVSGFAWGYLSDKIGRKMVILTGLASIMLFSMLFGLSTTFTGAITSRFLLGITNGIVPAARTSVREVCGQAHVVTGMAYVGGSRAVSLVIGTGIGGLLATPASHYPGVFSPTGLYARHPFLLPNLLGAIFAAISFVWVAICLPETKNMDGASSGHDSEDTEGLLSGMDGNPPPMRTWSRDAGSSTTDYSSSDSDSAGGLAEWGYSSPKSSGNMKEKRHSKKGSLCTPLIAMVLFLGCIVEMMAIGFDEVFPLWALSTPDVGGLGWGTKGIGKVLFTAGALLAMLQLMVFPRMIKRVGVMVWQRAGCLVGVAAFFIAPNARMLSWNMTSLFSVCVTSTLFVNISTAAVGIALTVASTSIVPPHQRGKLGGLYNTAESLGRFTGPVGYATTYAKSIAGADAGKGVMDYHFVFYASAAAMVVITALCWVTLTAETLTQPTGKNEEQGPPHSLPVNRQAGKSQHFKSYDARERYADLQRNGKASSMKSTYGSIDI